jgi:hypothetical protein
MKSSMHHDGNSVVRKFITDFDARVMASENRYTPLEYDLSHDPKPDIIPHLATIVRCWVLQIPEDQLTNLALKYEQDQKCLNYISRTNNLDYYMTA